MIFTRRKGRGYYYKVGHTRMRGGTGDEKSNTSKAYKSTSAKTSVKSRNKSMKRSASSSSLLERTSSTSSTSSSTSKSPHSKKPRITLENRSASTGLGKASVSTKDVLPVNLYEVKCKENHLYTDDVVFQFFSNSRNEKPGKGAGESLPDDRKEDFQELGTISEWRKKLSNFWLQPFYLDGLEWSSVEHYYQASKFKNGFPHFYQSFSLTHAEPGSNLSIDPLMAKAAGGKSGKYQKKELRPAHYKADSDFFKTSRRYDEMYEAQKAKFSQHEDLKKLLLATRDAKLYHVARSTKIVFYELMVIRDEFNN